VHQVTGSDGQDTGAARGPDPRRHRLLPRTRGRIVCVAAVCAVLAAGGLTAAALNIGRGGARPESGAVVSGAVAGNDPSGSAVAGMPQTAATPRVAIMPKPTTHPATPTATGATPAPSIASSRSAGDTAAPSSIATPSATSPAVSGTSTCTHPQFVSSAQFGMWNLAPYFVYNNMWGVSGYSVSQTIYACSYSNWYVTATMNNDSGNGAVKTYPDSQKDFSEPKISSLNSVTSTFAETSPNTGIYEDAYDIWLNGIASSGSTELMIWTDNHGQTPSGTAQGTVTFGGQSYTAYRTTSGSYIALVANTNFASGTIDLLAVFKWLIGKGWIPPSSTLGQVCYGVELVSTNGAPATFTFSNYAVNAS
jgi:hypothetical protein